MVFHDFIWVCECTFIYFAIRCLHITYFVFWQFIPRFRSSIEKLVCSMGSLVVFLHVYKINFIVSSFNLKALNLCLFWDRILSIRVKNVKLILDISPTPCYNTIGMFNLNFRARMTIHPNLLNLIWGKWAIWVKWVNYTKWLVNEAFKEIVNDIELY